jgi:hypothetical protein
VSSDSARQNTFALGQFSRMKTSEGLTWIARIRVLRSLWGGALSESFLSALAAAAADGDQSNVASIVDSVVADLRPKLMEEINRKMSKKK